MLKRETVSFILEASEQNGGGRPLEITWRRNELESHILPTLAKKSTLQRHLGTGKTPWMTHKMAPGCRQVHLFPGNMHTWCKVPGLFFTRPRWHPPACTGMSRPHANEYDLHSWSRPLHPCPVSCSPLISHLRVHLPAFRFSQSSTWANRDILPSSIKEETFHDHFTTSPQDPLPSNGDVGREHRSPEFQVGPSSWSRATAPVRPQSSEDQPIPSLSWNQQTGF